jgi:hypothetical protein
MASFNGENLLAVLEQISEIVLDDTSYPYSKIVYKKIFEEKVLAFLETGDFKNQIQKYIEKYNELVSKSTFLKKEFNHYHASTVHKNLNENGFFKAEHTINLKVDGIKKEIQNEKELIKMIDDEKEKILTDDSLKTNVGQRGAPHGLQQRPYHLYSYSTAAARRRFRRGVRILHAWEAVTL